MVLTVIFGLGVFYFVMIVRTFASYGEHEEGWRQSWLKNGGFGRAERVRERQRLAQERDRERDRGRPRVRESDRERAPVSEPSATGLGLTNLSAGGNLSSMSDNELDKKDEPFAVEMERIRGRISPKL